MQVTVFGPLPEKRQLLEGCSVDRNFMRGTDGNNLFACSGGCDTSGGRTVIAGCRNDSQSSVPGIFGGIYEHSALCCLLSGFGTNGDIQDVNAENGNGF